MPITSAVVLAAGRGSRFWPYNVVRNKAAFPIANVPAIRRTVDALVLLGINRIVVVTGPGEASVRAALRGTRGDVRFVRQPLQAGTADAALHAASHIDGDFLILFGDVVTDPANIETIVSHFDEMQPMAAALIQPLDEERPQDLACGLPRG